jgi:hypothetical protein
MDHLTDDQKKTFIKVKFLEISKDNETINRDQAGTYL